MDNWAKHFPSHVVIPQSSLTDVPDTSTTPKSYYRQHCTENGATKTFASTGHLWRSDGDDCDHHHDSAGDASDDHHHENPSGEDRSVSGDQQEPPSHEDKGKGRFKVWDYNAAVFAEFDNLSPEAKAQWAEKVAEVNATHEALSKPGLLHPSNPNRILCV